ncbi:tetratricopeptide repeat-containing serine protease family protein [Nitrosospira sp. Is2]|uniref:tetratricopeptide repeat-containing S1 family peptidase n=1 Tax=Nitrosospira sp. Is2 TaxID=3080532 RepID=UPI0029555429|nr:tetratricopeptide repeat-containing serine protease family protein [Nitrosospira sp. Is2]WON75302.1 tetratricopeptide repeat-containing serine protease family protein [Nitrosospira sp. Is2]
MNDTVVILNLSSRTHERRVSAILKTFVIALLSTCASADAARETPEARIFTRVSPSVVGVNMGDARSNSVGEGSGVVIGAGQVITTCHVAGKGKNGHVVHSGKRYEATLQSAQPDLDLCLLNVPGLQGPAATLGSALNVKTGQHIYAIGMPIDWNPPQPILSKGVISNLRPYLRSQYMRIAVPVSSGFSGGGLFDAHGALIGILSHPEGKGGDVTFALPADWIGELPIKVRPGPEMIKKDESAWLNRALTLEKSADWRGLLKLSQQEVNLDSENAAAWFSMGMAFANLKQYEQAVRAYREAIRNQSEYGDAWHHLGVAYANLKDYDNAIQAYRDALSMQPENAQAWYDLGLAYDDRKQHAHAIHAYREALRLDAENAAAWYDLGMTYDDLKLYGEAAEAYAETVRVQPENADAWYKLGVDYAILGERVKVRGVYQALRKLDTKRAEQYFNTYILP